MAARRVYPKVAVGDRFGRLEVIAPAVDYLWRGKPHGRQWHCRCSCKAETVARECHLQGGRIVSCGCHAAEQSGNRTRTHGLTGGGAPPEFNVWCLMRRRCLDRDDQNYSDYGARGIYVCDRWLGEMGFANFLADMGPRPSPQHTIERRDNNGPYAPTNCEWVLPAVQARNRRSNRWVEYGGRRLCLSDWARELGLTRNRLSRQLDAGWPLDRALRR
jgi:hypothetical protein